MKHRLTLRISEEDYQHLKVHACLKKISVSQIAREYILKSLYDKSEIENQKSSCSDFSPQSNKPLRESHPLLIETVLLLREMAISRDSQILRRVDSAMDDLLGEARKKIYDHL